MALEDITAGNTIANLVLTNPADGDDASQGDDHIRNLKKALQYSFPNISATASGVAAEFAFAHKGGTVSGNAVILGSLSVSGAMSVATTLSVSGAAVLKSTLNVEGAATISGAATIKGALSAEGALSAGGATTLASTLSVSGAAVFKSGVTLDSTFTVSGAAVMKSGLHIDGNLSVSGSIAGLNALGGILTTSKPARAYSTDYQNTGSTNLLVHVAGTDGASNSTRLDGYVGDSTASLSLVSSGGIGNNVVGTVGNVTFIVRVNQWYRVTNSGGSPAISAWVEYS